MKKKHLLSLFLMIFLSLSSKAQINYTYGWEPVGLGGWTNTGSRAMTRSTTNPCNDDASVRVNLYSSYPNNTFISPVLQGSNGGEISVSLNYKVVNFAGGAGANSNSFKINFQWANALTGPWYSFHEINESNHIVSNICTTVSKSFIPETGDIYVRFVTTRLSGNYYVYFDDVSIVQGSAPSCLLAENVQIENITHNSIQISWAAPNQAPANGYIYEIRTDTNPGTTGTGLILSGTALSNALTVDVTDLAPSTYYNMYFRVNCGNGDFSFWKKIAFKTYCASQNVPYTMPIDDTLGIEIPDCVTVLNSNDDDKTWQSNQPVSGINGRLMRYLYNPNLAADDWFFTRGLNLTADQPYRLKFKYKDTSFVEKLRVNLSLGSINTDLSNLLFDVNTGTEESVENVFVDFVAPTTGVYFIGFNVYSDQDMNALYIGEISVELAPSCIAPFDVLIENVTKNSAEISWSSPVVLPTNGYSYEVRTSGLPGSGSIGLVDSGTVAAGLISKTISSLNNSTEYYVYMQSVCSLSEKSDWTSAVKFITRCNYPDFVSKTPASRCGIGTAILSADFSDNSNVRWFSSAIDRNILNIGTNFTTPEINSTTSYFVEAGVPSLNIDVQVGLGTLNTYFVPASPFAYGWGGYKFQYIYTATELTEMGLLPGPINSVGFNIASGISDNRPGFTIYVGTTSQNMATTTHVGGLTLVYSNINQPLQLGINNYPFTSPFVWDGISNIVVQVSWSNVDAASGTPASMYYHLTPDYQATYSFGDFRTPQQLLDTMTGAPQEGPAGATNGFTNVGNLRPNTYFNGMGICNSPRQEVVVTVSPAPVLTLSDTSFTICEGQSKLVTVTAGATDYSTFEWIPATGVSGTAATGFTFNPLVSTVYILKATQASGALCSEQVQINITVNELPTFTPLETSYEVCANEILELNPNASGLGDFIVGSATTLTDHVDSTTAFNNRWYGSRQQYIYTKEELNALGFYSGKIKGLAFEVATLGSSPTNANYTIKMKAVTESSFVNTTFLTGDFVTVFGPVTYTHTATGWHNFDFTTSFVWDGISNILIELTHNGAYSITNAQTFFTETADNKSLVANTATDATGTLSLKRLNTKFFDEGLSTTVWSPITNLYTDEAATIPYTGGNAKKVYFKSAQSITTDYEAILTGFNQCATSLTTEVSTVLIDAPVVIPQTFCEAKAVSDIVVVELMTDGLVKWYSSATSSDEITTITTSGTYYVTQTVGDCSSERVAVVISIKTITDAPAVEEIQNLCGPVTVADLQATPLAGNTISWFATMTSTTELASGDNVTTGSYYVAQFNGDCWSPRAKVTVNVNPVPVAPTAVNQDFCGIHTLSEVNLGQANNTTLKWYRTNTSTSVLPLTTVIETGTYYVSQTISACESARVAVTMSVIDALPAPAAPAVQAFCGSAIVSDLTYTAAQGAIVGWFTSQNEMTPLVATQNLTSRIYYVAQYNGSCWSPKTEVQVQVNPIPAAPNNTALQLCGTYNFGQLSLGQAPNASLNWYSTVSSLTPIAPSTTVLTGTYFVSQTIRGCESVRVSINVIATETLLLPVATAQSFCGGATVSSLVAQGASGATFNWYPSANSITPLAPNTLLTTGTYYVSQSKNVCSSGRVPVTVHVGSSVAPLVNPFNFCGSAKVSDLIIPSATGISYKWFSSSTSTTELASSTVLVSGTYYVSRIENGCESSKAPVLVTIHTIPNAPTGNASQSFGVGATINSIVLDQQGVVWYSTYYDSQNGINPLSPGMLLVNGTTYYGVQIGTNNCASLQFAVTVDVVLSDKEFEKSELKYHPNPVDEVLNIVYSEKITQIEVFDLLGKRVKVQNTDDHNVIIDLSELASGTYMLQLRTETKSQFIKVIKK